MLGMNTRQLSQELEAGRYYCGCCQPPALLIRRARQGELLASCLNSGKLYRASGAGQFVRVEEGDFEGGRWPSLAPATTIDLSRESYS
jgi:hypothetical protein